MISSASLSPSLPLSLSPSLSPSLPLSPSLRGGGGKEGGTDYLKIESITTFFHFVVLVSLFDRSEVLGL